VTGAAAAAVVSAPLVFAATVPTPRNGHAPFEPITTTIATVSVTGGVAPYTYAWVLLSGDPFAWVINAPTSSATNFTCTNTGGDFATATFQCTVTDATAATAVTNTLTANATAIG
jgi:hypothetical protein